jgi:ribonucleoside-diphosphate reductase alpha chain
MPGLTIKRVFSRGDLPAREQIEWKTVRCELPGSGLPPMDVEVPVKWSDTATFILASKYFRKAGVPSAVHSVSALDPKHAYLDVSFDDGQMPHWLWPSIATPEATIGAETSAHQVFHRLAGCWTYWGWREGIFTTEVDARAFYDETYVSLALQVAAPNSPQWFNTGLHWAYGIEGPASGQWAIGPDGVPFETTNAYERPQPHACFIQPIKDDLVNPGGIMDLAVREARLFKQGSGTGTNFSTLRGPDEKLSGGGVASGLMSFLKIGDVAAGSIKSGGVTRRAAKMVCVDADHPEIEAFVNLKAREELKAASMYVGSALIQHVAEGGESPVVVPDAILDRIEKGLSPEVFGIGWQGEAIESVQGQNANNSVRVSHAFMNAVHEDTYWNLTARTDGRVVKTIKARGLWDQINLSSWSSADPGLQFDGTINEWHTCPNDGPIRSSNPCAEYNFLDDTACNLASINLVPFHTEDGRIDVEAYEHACFIWQLVLEISIEMASFPSREIALGTYNYRTTGLGYMNLGALLMRLGLPYGSDEGRALAAALTAMMTGVAYRTSGKLAEVLGPFPRWEANAEPMSRVLRNHARACGAIEGRYEGLVIEPVEYRKDLVPFNLQSQVETTWQAVLVHAVGYGFRNAQTTVIAPTGTISLVADCDTSGCEPFFAFATKKDLVGGGSLELVSTATEEALRRLDYDPEVIPKLLGYLKTHGSFDNCADLDPGDLPVFLTAQPAREGGSCLTPEDHVRLVAAIQPFLSGAASKTVNLPRTATVEDVAKIHLLAYQLGVKAVALYRDGSKLSQPMSVSRPAAPKAQSGELVRLPTAKAEVDLQRGEREYLPWRREGGYTQKVKIGPAGQSVFLTVNSFPDGRPGEMFLELGHQGTTLRAMADMFSIAVSVGLQYGVPVREYVERLLNTRFEPAGLVEGHDRVKQVASIGDFVARDLGIAFLGQHELGQVVPAQAIDTGNAVVALDRRAIAAATGDVCSCGSINFRQSGTCKTCEDCGETTGCG